MSLTSSLVTEFETALKTHANFSVPSIIFWNAIPLGTDPTLALARTSPVTESTAKKSSDPAAVQ